MPVDSAARTRNGPRAGWTCAAPAGRSRGLTPPQAAPLRQAVPPFVHAAGTCRRTLTEWRLWVTTVFLPNIQAMRDLVIKHADLLSEAEMPPLLLQMCAHVSGYEITAARWAQGNQDEHLSAVSFPGEELAAHKGVGWRPSSFPGVLNLPSGIQHESGGQDIGGTSFHGRELPEPCEQGARTPPAPGRP